MKTTQKEILGCFFLKSGFFLQFKDFIYIIIKIARKVAF